MARMSSPSPGRPISIELDGKTLEAREGQSVATALVAADVPLLSRSVKYHRPRGAFCLGRSCGNCLLRIDGVPNVQGCSTPVRDGMQIERQNAFPSVQHDLFGTVDWFFPRGMDHHTMFAGVPVAETVMAKVARKLAGFGTLPDQNGPPALPAEERRVDIAVVGAGPAGLAAAQALSEAGADFLLIEREPAVGGRMVRGPLEEVPGLAAPDASRVVTRAQVFGIFTDAGGRFLAVDQHLPGGQRLLKVYAPRILLTVGGHARLLPFRNNELPGIYSGRAATRLVREDGVRPGERVALVGHGAELEGVARALSNAGIAPVLTLDLGGPGAEAKGPSVEASLGAIVGVPTIAHGRARVRALSYRTVDGAERRVVCDAVILAVPPSPAYELAGHLGAPVDFDPEQETFRVRASEDGRTEVEGLAVAGELTGPKGAREAADSGRRAALALLGDVQ